ncbi:c-type cytochrome [Rhodopirellula sp. MGV]|uniref:c-type cytochrome n=1 Tax=Rhodopirellula sp. MGV TaxID=2023130 RepID=UPI000B966E0F|nr:c-type cytochrome [Rhodopirellula sp. MGV]OYP36559.1 hypothetical protein CGZ80_07965 [Rhodopirellula sp. MGV]PNY34535.1 cytochrome oxidase [Rhodopirellula baltica]
MGGWQRLTWWHRTSVWIVMAFGLDAITFATASVYAEDSDVAFVIGFERFGRHGEVDEKLMSALLVSELNCIACHASSALRLTPKLAPRLDGVGNRLDGDWIRAFLHDPQSTKPGATMPAMFTEFESVEKNDAIDALVAYLGSRTKAFIEPKAGGALPVIHEFWRHGDPTTGQRLYHTVGCVACHEPDDRFETAEAAPSAIDTLIENLDADELDDLGLASAARRIPSIPHSELSHKFSLRSLTAMLLNPSQTHPNARMPNLRLSPQEAADIAAYLMGMQADNTSTKNPQSEIPQRSLNQELIDKGARLFVEMRCVNCHREGGSDSRPAKVRFGDLDFASQTSCIQNAAKGMPQYKVDDEQRRSIAGAHDVRMEPGFEPRDASVFRMMQLNCYGCHERDGIGGVGRYRKPYFETVGHVDLGDEGRLPPSLGQVGWKLQRTALANIFKPQTSPHRAYLSARMPAYPAESVNELVINLRESDSSSAAERQDKVESADELISAGRELANTGCVQCHVFRGESLPGVVGVDLSGINSRVSPSWFHAFVRDPGAIKSRTRMPTFFPDGASNRKDLLDGDVDRQLSALWSYLSNLGKQALPKAIAEARSANYELSPTDKPMILRTFMDDVGTHAIAVGFPQKRHYAFDAESCQLTAVWKGQFIDAQGTWYERFAPPATPLGSDVALLSPVQLSLRGILLKPSFTGYRLDKDRVPTMRYDFGNIDCSDHVVPNENRGFRRELRFTGSGVLEHAELALHRGSSLKLSEDGFYVSESGVGVRLVGAWAANARVTETNGVHELTVPIDGLGDQTLAMEYQW